MSYYSADGKKSFGKLEFFALSAAQLGSFNFSDDHQREFARIGDDLRSAKYLSTSHIPELDLSMECDISNSSRTMIVKIVLMDHKGTESETEGMLFKLIA
jgi:hypothetical protein